MIPRKQFLFYLIDTPTGGAYYLDESKVIQKINIATADFDVSLQNSPGGWLDTELGFIRNEKYYGFNRSFATPQEFVKEVAYMVRSLFLTGVGTETPLTLAVFKYNSKPKADEPSFKLYYKAPLDLPKFSDTVATDVNVNLMEGGVSQLLKSYENTVFQIPCDGSLPENVKANLDGLLVQDTFQYQFVSMKDVLSIRNILPLNFVGNEGDNYGILKGFPTFQTLSSYSELINNSNYLFASITPITVRIRGSVNVVNLDLTTTFTLKYTTDKTLADFTEIVGPFPINNNHIFNFDFTVNLAAYEKLFLIFDMLVNPGSIVAGQLSIEFVSSYPTTRTWGIDVYNLFKLLVKNICTLASKNGQTFNYGADSELLQQYSGIIAASGDAIRASGDPSYQRFFHPADINGNISYGPVLKTSLFEFFESLSSILCAALGSQQLAGQVQSLFIEKLESVFNSSKVDMELGEISELKVYFNEKYTFSDLEIGYAPQTYDQKAGKYEYNTTGKWKAPINTFQKTISKIGKYRTDSYGIERLRSNIGQATSTTRNDSDNSVFLISTDKTSWAYDYFKQYFNSLISDPDSSENTNIKLVTDRNLQPLSLPLSDGEYFQPNLDQGIFIFSKDGYSATESSNLTITGTLDSINHVVGTPLDTIEIKLWYNGVAIYSQTITYAGPGTAININHNFSQLFFAGGCVYVTATTSATGVASLTTSVLTIGTYVSMSGAFIPVESGTAIKVISMGTVIPTSTPWNNTTSVVQYGYQYFIYNSLAVNNEFELTLNLKGYQQGTVDFVNAIVYINGVAQAAILQIPTTISRATFDVTKIIGTYNFNLGDIVFIAVTVPGSVTFSITNAYFNFASTQVKAYNLLRENYDSISGIPNIATDADGNLSTTVAGAPYNIEHFTPKRMLEKWQGYIESCFLDKVTGDLNFQSLSKNQYLSTSKGGVTITESTNKKIINNKRLFYPLEVEIKTKVPLNFNEIVSGAKNAHIHCTFYGYDIYFFPEDVRQKPGLNEAQTWKGILSPLTNLSDLANINIDGLKLLNMGANSIHCSMLSSVQCVPENQTLPAKYHTYNRNEFLFKEQIGQWMEQMNYWQPVQQGDVLPLQFITRGLDPVSCVVYKCDGTIYIPSFNLDTISATAITDPYILWQKLIDTSDWEVGNYYMRISAGVGDIAAVLRTEYLQIMLPEDCEDTVLIEYSNSFNTQDMIFDGETPFRGSFRFKGGFNNKFKQKYLGKFYVDQPQDITILNAIPYEITSLLIGGNGGVPDYVAKKVLRALLLDGTTLDGEGYSLNEGSQIEETFTKGAPMKFQRIEIRPSKNLFGITVDASGIDTDGSIIATIDAESFGPNSNNESGTTDPNIIDVILNN